MKDPPNKNPFKAAAGRKGGQETFKRHGHEHMAKIGSRGAETTHQRYRWLPVGTSGYALVHRETDEIVAICGTQPW